VNIAGSPFRAGFRLLVAAMAAMTAVIAMTAWCARLPAADGVGELPSDRGQFWKNYDIGPFVSQAGAGSQKHVVDWVLQDTGYASWHGDTVASLSADESAVRCFHTPEMQARVERIVARFVQDVAAPHRFSVRVLGVGSPSWRNDARNMLRPIPAATPGVQAWTLSREEAALLLAMLRRRSDCQELPTGPVLAGNGLPAVLSGGRRRPYVRDVAARPDVWPGWQALGAVCDEGFSLDVHPLMSQDGAGVEAVLRCRIDQIERMATVAMTAPTADGSRVPIEVPQMSAVRIGERFSWPATQVLVVGLGLVPWPVPGQNTAGTAALLTDAKRTDVVVVVEPRLSDAP
jgi:hypothetical protein